MKNSFEFMGLLLWIAWVVGILNLLALAIIQ